MPMLLMGAGMVGISSAPPTNATANKLLTAVYPDGTRIAHVFMQRSVCTMCANQEAKLKIEIRCMHGVPNTNSVTSARHRARVTGLLKGDAIHSSLSCHDGLSSFPAVSRPMSAVFRNRPPSHLA